MKNSEQNLAGSLTPITTDERIAALDLLRGFAIGGVLLAYTLWNLGSPAASTYSWLDRALDGVLSFLVDTKFYTLLAFLFGLGFALQLTRAEASGGGIVKLYCRRLLALLLIGLAHALLLRNGDILVPYATMGFVLLLLRNESNALLAMAAVGGLLFPYLARAAVEWTGFPFPQQPAGDGQGFYAENFAWVRHWYAFGIVNWPGALPMFLFGLYAGRRRWFENIAVHRKALGQVLLAGFTVGVLAYANRAWLLSQGTETFAQRLSLGVLWSLHAWGMAAGYAATLMLLADKPAWQRWLAPLGAVGKMALTNYLLQAALIVPLCLGFDWFDRITPSRGLLLALAVWSLQVPLSVWWLRRYRFGPAEWLWRSLTYGRRQPMSISQEIKHDRIHQTDLARPAG
jgi:uncharacterized protein